MGAWLIRAMQLVRDGFSNYLTSFISLFWLNRNVTFATAKVSPPAAVITAARQEGGDGGFFYIRKLEAPRICAN